MKNLLNTIVFKSVALFAMVLLVAFAVTTSFNPLDQSNDVGGKNKDIIKHATNIPIAIIGGGEKGTSTTLKADIGGSKGIKGEVIDNQYEISDIGGRNTNTTGNFSVDDIGGRNGSGTSTGGEFQITDIGGRSTTSTGNYTSNDIGGRGTNTGTGEYSISDIGGRSTNSTGNFASNDIGGSRDHVIIRRIPIPFTFEIGGKSTTIGQ